MFMLFVLAKIKWKFHSVFLQFYIKLFSLPQFSRYHLAESIDAQLKRMAEDIKEIIEHVNTANKTQDESDPVRQF